MQHVILYPYIDVTEGASPFGVAAVTADGEVRTFWGESLEAALAQLPGELQVAAAADETLAGLAGYPPCAAHELVREVRTAIFDGALRAYDDHLFWTDVSPRAAYLVAEASSRFASTGLEAPDMQSQVWRAEIGGDGEYTLFASLSQRGGDSALVLTQSDADMRVIYESVFSGASVEHVDGAFVTTLAEPHWMRKVMVDLFGFPARPVIFQRKGGEAVGFDTMTAVLLSSVLHAAASAREGRPGPTAEVELDGMRYVTELERISL